MESANEVNGEILSVFYGGVSEKATGYRTYIRTSLVVAFLAIFALYCYFVVNYSVEGKLFALVLGAMMLVCYQMIGVSRQKQLKLEETRSISIHTDGVVVKNSNNKIEFSEGYEKMIEPSTKTLLDCYRLELQNKYGMRIFVAMKSLDECWKVSDEIRDTAEKNGFILGGRK